MSLSVPFCNLFDSRSDTWCCNVCKSLIYVNKYYWSQESISSVILCHFYQSHVLPLYTLFLSMSPHSKPLNLHHTVYIISPMVCPSAEGNPQNKDTICSIFSSKCNTIYKCGLHFNHWISFLYLHINIYVMMIFFLL
jgi:hypothetical protein